jgi:signal transduction histidine kinase
MDRQDEQANSALATEVVAALRDLARMAEHAGSAGSDAAGSVARMLLERLLVLCAAQHGALFLTGHPSRESARDFLSSFPNSRNLHTLALYGINEEEAYALLQLFPSGDASIKTSSGERSWDVYRLPLTASFVQQQGHQEPGHVTFEQEPGQAAQPLQAVLLLGWSGQEDAERTSSAAEKGRAILPLVEEAVGAVLVNMLLAVRVHELETALENRSLREMELLKAELLATVSHELRSPLASIKGYAATLLRHERRISREERHEFLIAIATASDRLERIIDRLLEMSQLETGTMSIERSPVDVVRLAQEAIAAAEQQTSTQLRGQFTFHLRLKDAAGVPAQEKPLIMADPRRLREVLDNLLENAVNYSPEGGVIDVVVQPIQALLPAGKASKRERKAEAFPQSDDAHFERPDVQPDGQKLRQLVEICVCDYGLGIPAEHLDRIFDRFHRVDTRLTREQSGLGLGLTICKHIVELHDGVIWAESCPAGGSSFHVRLPVDGEEKRLTPLVPVGGS